MLDNIKNLITLKSIDSLIAKGQFDLALNNLNELIKKEYKVSESFLKRGQLCHKLLLLDDAYSDFTYIIFHCADNIKAYKERLFLNFEMANYREAINDADFLIENSDYDEEYNIIKIMSFIFMDKKDEAKVLIMKKFRNHKFKALHFLFNEVAKVLSRDEYAKALSLLDVIDIIDPSNPLKLLEESNIYGLANQTEKQQELLKKIEAAFPKYFIAHFQFTDMYQERDIMEICFLLELAVLDKKHLFEYPIEILKGYKHHYDGQITESKECFENAIKINPQRAEAYVLLAQTLQLMSGYDNPKYKAEAKENYKMAMDIYYREHLTEKAEDMKRQLKHLSSTLVLK